MNPKQLIDILRGLSAVEKDIPESFRTVWKLKTDAERPEFYGVFTDGVNTALSYACANRKEIVRWSTRINSYTPSDLFNDIEFETI